jgi:Zn-dependent metalloprotease
MRARSLSLSVVLPWPCSWFAACFVACFAATPACTVDADGPPAQGMSALAALEEESGIAWRGVFDPITNLASMIDGLADGPSDGPADGPAAAVAAPADVTAGAPAVARAFLLFHPGLFGGAAHDQNLWLRDVAPDDGGGATVRFEIRIGGLRYAAGEALVTIGADGGVRAVTGAFPPAAELSASPEMDAASAVGMALAWLNDEALPGKLALEEPAELVAEPVGMEVRAAWRCVISGEGMAGPIRREILVDAAQPLVLAHREGLWAVRAVGSGVGVDGTRRPLQIYQAPDGSYQLRDDTRGSQGIRTYTAEATQRLPGWPVTSPAADQWDQGIFGAGAAVDAHAHAGEVYDWLSGVLRRQSLDGKGGGMRLTVHFGARMDNAFWDGHEAVFGDGDGTTMKPLATLDVVAHELFHAVTQAESGLTYQGESGALNESLSDVFATFVELDVAAGNWTVGEGVTTPAIRDLARPERTGSPEHMSQYVQLPNDARHDMGGVHVNSTIPSHAAYLLAMGGVSAVSGLRVPAIGVVATRRIWWRAATRYLGARARFADFAEATRAAAEDLFGKRAAEVKAVEAAWTAVGVR